MKLVIAAPHSNCTGIPPFEHMCDFRAQEALDVFLEECSECVTVKYPPSRPLYDANRLYAWKPRHRWQEELYRKLRRAYLYFDIHSFDGGWDKWKEYDLVLLYIPGESEILARRIIEKAEGVFRVGMFMGSAENANIVQAEKRRVPSVILEFNEHKGDIRKIVLLLLEVAHDYRSR